MKNYRPKDDHTIAKAMVSFAKLQAKTEQPIAPTVIAHMLKMHRQYELNHGKGNTKYHNAKQFFIDFAKDYGVAHDGTLLWSVHFQSDMPNVYWTAATPHTMEVFPI